MYICKWLADLWKAIQCKGICSKMEKILRKTLSLSGSLFENDFIEQEEANQSIVSNSQGINLQEWLERPHQ